MNKTDPNQNLTEYIGMTIGPILSTMDLFTSPAALWASSYLFSFISKTIRDVLIRDYRVKAEDIIAPYVDPSADGSADDDGIGRYHDRIIFVKKDFDLKDVAKLKDTVIGIASESFGLEKSFLLDYVSIVAVCYCSDNAILGSAKLLDCMELSIPFLPTESMNPILALFTGGDGDGQKNSAIKRIAQDQLGIKAEKWQLLSKDQKIRSIGEIAGTYRESPTDDADKRERKRYRYYTVLRCDGDNMTQIISSLKGNTKEDNPSGFSIQDYSQACLNYCQAVSRVIKEYGGVTIFASGDDLLALLPCSFAIEGKERTLLNLFDGINQCFQDSFQPFIQQLIKEKETKKEILIPSLSLAALIAYYKYPLYEAVNESADLLFQNAKKRKDCCCVKLVKHSGQELCFILPNASLKKQEDVMGDGQNVLLHFAEETMKMNDTEEILYSVLYHLQDFHKLFHSFAIKHRKPPVSLEEVKLLFCNVFDGADQSSSRFLTELLPRLYWQMITGMIELYPLDDDILMNELSQTGTEGDQTKPENERTYSECSALIYLLRFLKFYAEKKGD